MLRRMLPALALCVFARAALAQQPPAPTQAAPSFIAPEATNPSPDALALFNQLQALRLDAVRVYSVQNIFLHRGAANITLQEGKLAFFEPLDGKITGAVFNGTGRVTLLPREPSEKLSLLHFLGVPLLDQDFTRVYFRFDDDTASSLRAEIESQGAVAAGDPEFADPWTAILPGLNSWHSLRIMTDWLASEPRPYFYAGVFGGPAGPFDILVDPRREEPVLVGQAHINEGLRVFDVWASLPTLPSWQYVPEFRSVDYDISTNIHDDHSLDGATTMKIRALADGQRVLPLRLARALQVDLITNADGSPLLFFPGAEFDRGDALHPGTEIILVVLDKRVQSGEEFDVKLSYHGTIIASAGNGVLYVGERGSWYPGIPGPDSFTPVRLAFRWPHALTLVATGDKLDEHEEGGAKIGHWSTTVPIAVAGFNLGEYASHAFNRSEIKVEVYANRQLESAIASRMNDLPEGLAPESLPPGVGLNPEDQQIVIAPHAPSPAAVLSHLGTEVLNSVEYLEKWNGPYPFSTLDVTQIPGSFGQGWPGLVYLPTLSFLPQRAQQEAGADPRVQQELNELVPYHEVTHQWWGNVVGAESYRDSWLFEAMANYLALLYADSRKDKSHVLDEFLEHFRSQLLVRPLGSRTDVEEVGPLCLGYRLASDKGDSYDAIMYGKGTWVIHMLRMMLRNTGNLNSPTASADSAAPPSTSAGTPDADARFAAVLRDVLTQYKFQPISTADLQHAVEAHMTPVMDVEGGHSMDWFFSEWIQQTGIPAYSVEFHARSAGNRNQISGVLHQDDVPSRFAMPVPLYASSGNEKPVYLGTVSTSGAETKFQFTSSVHPSRILIDPYHTILCQTN